MNKYQEAMNYLWNLYDENKIYGIASRGYLEILQGLVDKATPKKLVATRHTRRCPSCNRQMSDINNAHPNIKFCPNCGQALDWSTEMMIKKSENKNG